MPRSLLFRFMDRRFPIGDHPTDFGSWHSRQVPSSSLDTKEYWVLRCFIRTAIHGKVVVIQQQSMTLLECGVDNSWDVTMEDSEACTNHFEFYKAGGAVKNDVAKGSCFAQKLNQPTGLLEKYL
jgi:hypothetical protein